MTDLLPAIGCAGAGTLGAAIMRRLIDCGHPVLVWNRSAARLAPLLEAGAKAVDTPAGLAQGADFVVTCVTDGNAVEELVLGDGAHVPQRMKGVLNDIRCKRGTCLLLAVLAADTLP